MAILENFKLYIFKISSKKIKVGYFIYLIYMGIFNDNTNKKVNKIEIQEKLSSKPTTYINSIDESCYSRTWANTHFNFYYTSKFPNESVAIHFKSQLQFESTEISVYGAYFRWKVTCITNNNIYYPGLAQLSHRPQNNAIVAGFGWYGQGGPGILCSISNTTIFITKKDEISYLFTLQCRVRGPSATIRFNGARVEKGSSTYVTHVTSSIEIIEVRKSHVTGTSGFLIYT